jgi:hypothetical protein
MPCEKRWLLERHGAPKFSKDDRMARNGLPHLFSSFRWFQIAQIRDSCFLCGTMNRIAYLGALVLAASFAPALLAQPTQLRLDRDLGPVRITLDAEPGFDYRLEAAPTVSPAGGWDFLGMLALDGNSQNWLDAQSTLLPQRFYRAVKLSPAPSEPAPDFRLIDHLGRSQRLYYYFGAPNVRAVVLMFTGNGCVKLREMVPAIKALANRFTSQGVVLWLVDANAGDNRSNILVEATSIGLSNGPPILHDAAQLVARAYHASATPEAVAIDTSTLSIFYRGAVDDRVASNAVATTQHYLSNALSGFLASGTVSPRQTQPAGCAIALNPPYPDLSYANDIAPLLQAKCVRCHSPGNIGTWAMTNHAIVQLRAQFIREQVMSGLMPPWHADPFYGSFTNDSSMKPDESAKLIQWLDAGAPRGTGPDPLVESPPSATIYPYAWPANLGQPDAILRIPLQSVPADGTVDYRYINVVNTAFATDVWLRAAVVRPSNSRVVHHCLVFQGTGGLNGLDGFFAGYVPGADPTSFPAGTGKLLKRGETLRFQMHYTTVGESLTDQTEIGLYVMPVPPAFALQTRSAFNGPFTLGTIPITANTGNFELTAQHPSSGTLTTNIVLYEMSPHMHLRGSHFKYEAVYPNGTRETLLSVPYYIFHWQALYRLTQPKYLPRGSRIVCTAGWDNTAQNVELMEAYESSGNPGYLPGDDVFFGEQSWNEMFIGYMNYAEVPGPP